MTASLLWLLPAGLFILSSVASLIPLFPNQSYLKMDNLGITIKSMFQTIEIKWAEVENFYTEKKNQRDVVAFKFIDKKINYLNFKNIYSRTECLPDDYGMKAEELADLLEYRRIRGLVSEFSAQI